MTDKTKGFLAKFWYVLSIAIIAITFVITMVRAYDSISRLAETVDKVTCQLESEVKERTKMDTLLTQKIADEREARKEEYTDIQVRLTGIDTTLVYIKQGIDRLENTK
jgi:uncharacterized protein YoxC